MKKLLFLMLLLSSTASYATCPYIRPQINMKVDKGRLKYNHNISTMELQKKAGNTDPNMVVRGVTIVSPFKFAVTGGSKTTKTPDGYCVSITDVDVFVGFDTIDVYIDKKFKKTSCPYKIIKDHENYHVGVFRQGLDFYEDDIKKKVQLAVKKLRPQKVSSPAKVNDVLKRELNSIMKQVTPTIHQIDKKLRAKNMEIDTPESYAATEALCPNDSWK